MQRIIAALFFSVFFLLPLTAQANLNCSVGVATTVGSNVTGSITIFFSGGGTGYSWDVYSSTGHPVTWSPASQGGSGQPGSAITFNWTYVADADGGMTFTAVQFTGSTSDSCALNAFSTNYTAVPSWKKQAMNAWADYFSQVKDEMAAGSIACQIGASDPRAKIACITLSGLGVISDSVSKMLRRPDPWDPNFQNPYDPPWYSAEDLGLSYLDDGFGYYTQIVYDTEWIALFADGAGVTSDRVFSCHLAGDTSCESWQKDRLNWFLYMWGWYLNDMSGNLWVEAWILENYYGDLVSADTIQQMRDLAQSASDTGNLLEMQ